MNEEEKKALDIVRGLEFEEYDWYVKTDKIEGHANDVVEKVEKALQTILNLVEKQQKEIEELKYHIHYKTCAWCGNEFKTKSHNARYCPKCRETKKREIRISNCKKHYENNKKYFKNYYQNLTDEQKERRRANNREANRRLRERKKCK